jgi:sorbitol-specific phosphotransferase system component IIC
MFAEIVNLIFEKSGVDVIINSAFVSGFPFLLVALLTWYLNFTLFAGPKNAANQAARSLRYLMIAYNLLLLFATYYILEVVSITFKDR